MGNVGKDLSYSHDDPELMRKIQEMREGKISLIEDYKKALQAIYDHVGFVEDWVICPIDDTTEMYWMIDDGEVRYGPHPEDATGETDQTYSSEIYKKWVYRGADFTMILTNPRVDGMRYFSIFNNAKEIHDSPQG